MHDDDDDDNEDQDNDVFCDPGFTPDIEEFFDDDKENEDCIEIGTPGTSAKIKKVSQRTMQSVEVCYFPHHFQEPRFIFWVSGVL